jgi:Zn-dependent M28 family amino/carboxypeptidase
MAACLWANAPYRRVIAKPSRELRPSSPQPKGGVGMPPSKARRSGAFVVAITAVALVAGTVAADDLSESKGFRKGVTLAGIREHQAALQAISDANGGNRVAGSAAFVASRDYVVTKMTAAGYDVSTQAFQFVFNADATPPTLEQVSPTATTYVDGNDFSTMTFSGNIATTTAAVWAVDLVLPNAPGPGATTSGCEAADFAGMPVGSIALIQRGTCTFGLKTDNAMAAGAAAAVIFNDGGDAGRVGVINGTLGPGTHGPAVGTTLALGQDLANGVASGATGSTVKIRIDRINETRTTHNVIAETPGGDPNRVVVVGAHLDSVTRGPGINDNGSGSSTNLEMAETYAAQNRIPRNKLRFIWFSAEEFGLLGSQAYVDSLSTAQRGQIMAMINFDMVGSPNYVRFVYDGDNSTGQGTAGPAGSAYLETLFVEYFNAMGLANDPTPFNGRSDYGPFIAVGIPAGGLFTGAEGIKTAAQVVTYGGQAGHQYDDCYHLACDTYTGTNTAYAKKGLDEMSDAAAHVVLSLSRTKVDVRLTEAAAALRSSGSLVNDSPGPDPLLDR